MHQKRKPLYQARKEYPTFRARWSPTIAVANRSSGNRNTDLMKPQVDDFRRMLMTHPVHMFLLSYTESPLRCSLYERRPPKLQHTTYKLSSASWCICMRVCATAFVVPQLSHSVDQEDTKLRSYHVVVNDILSLGKEKQ